MIIITTIADNNGSRVTLSDDETPSGEVCSIECESFWLALNLSFEFGEAFCKFQIPFNHIVEPPKSQ